MPSVLKEGPSASSPSVHSPDTLKEAPVPIISTKRCNSSCMYNGEITSRMLCAGYTEGKVDACQVSSIFSAAPHRDVLNISFNSFFLFSDLFRMETRRHSESQYRMCVSTYCVSRVTAGVLWYARMKMCGGWWASSAGVRAAPSPTTLGFTPKSLSSWAGSMT